MVESMVRAGWGDSGTVWECLVLGGSLYLSEPSGGQFQLVSYGTGCNIICSDFQVSCRMSGVWAFGG
jgi:hypothetical protein